MKKLTLLLLFLVTFVANIFAMEKVSLQLSWKHQFQSAGYYMAKEKGFYKKVGLDVEIKEYDNTTHSTDDILNQKAHFGVGRSSLIHDRLEGKPVVLLASIFQHSPVVLLTKKREDLQKITDFKNKKIMLTNDYIGLASINAMLISSGIKNDMYETIAHSFNVNDLINNKADAVLAYISNEPFMMEQQKIEYSIFSPKEYGFDFYSDILFTSEFLIENNPLVVKNFRNASLKGWQYAMNNPDEAVALILKKYNTQNKTKAALEYEAKTIITLIDAKHVPIGTINKTRVDNIAKVYKLMGFVNKNLSIKNLIYSSAHDIEKEKLDDNFNIDIFLNKIIPLLKKPLYNIDTEDLSSLLKALILENKNVQAISLKESLDKEIVFRFYKNSDNLIFNEKIPEHYFKNKSTVRNITYDGEEVGEISVYYKENSNDIELTAQEKEWLASHTVSVGVEQWNPVIFSNNGSDIDGIAGDFIKKVIKSTGMKTIVINDLWDTILTSFRDGKIDILPATYYTEERSGYGLYSQSYFKMKDFIYVRNDNNTIRSLTDLQGKSKTLAVVKGYGTLPKLIEKYPDIEIVYTKDLDESIHKLIIGEVDALYEGGIAVEKKISEELITGIKGYPESSFKASALHIFSKVDEPILASILNKALKNITPAERKKIISKWFVEPKYKKQLENENQEKKISFIGLMSMQELIIIALLFLVFAYIVYRVYLKSDILDIRLKTFAKVIIALELGIILFLIYEIIVLDRTENTLAKATAEKFQMIQVADKLRQSSDDLTHFARTYAVTEDKQYESQYLATLKIRNGKIPRHIDYHSIYWDLDKEIREQRHPAGEKISLKALIKKLPFSKFEIIKMKEAEDNSNDLVNLEVEAFLAIKNNNALYASELLHSRAYYEAKHKIMLPIDEMMSALYKRTGSGLEMLEQKIQSQFRYILIIGLLFILGNIFLYIILSKKIILPIEYLTSAIRKFQNGEKDIEEESFYNDEIGEMNSEFFAMKKTLNYQTKDLKRQLRMVQIAERKQQELIKEIDEQKQFVQTLLDSQEQLIITTNGEKIISANETFFDFYAVDSVEDFMQTYDAKCVCDTFNTDAPDGYLQTEMGREIWIEYIISRSFDNTHKVKISMGNVDFIFSVTGAKLPGADNLKSAIFTNITDMEKAKNDIDEINKHTRESIEYAALIQSALIPNSNNMRKYFKDQFVIWHPKDTVGGDIYLFEELRHKDECLLMVIDCTGHGVPGAFVTMLVKAIERQITAKINNSDEIVSPAKILSIFNRNMKQLLKQENEDSISNAGFDGQIVYYNKKDKILKTASARNEIFYYQDDKLHVIKGDRYSVGYKDSDINFEFKEHTIDVSQETIIYISSDGYWDQNGGEKGLPYGKKRLKKMLDEIHKESMADQQEEFLYTFESYKAENEINDDVTVIGLKI